MKAHVRTWHPLIGAHNILELEDLSGRFGAEKGFLFLDARTLYAQEAGTAERMAYYSPRAKAFFDDPPRNQRLCHDTRNGSRITILLR